VIKQTKKTAFKETAKEEVKPNKRKSNLKAPLMHCLLNGPNQMEKQKEEKE
jgi:hypothetical protein